MTKEEIIDVIHKTMYQFFDVCGDNEEVPMSDKDELLLSVNKAICNNIKALCESCSENPNKWIPCSERLPEDRDWYLGIFKEPDTGWINPLPFICDYVGRKTKATTKEHWILRGFTDRDECMDYYFNLECVAWQPLPKPYKEMDSEQLLSYADQDTMKPAT